MSAKTGTQLASSTPVTVARKVYGGTMTSSPDSTPQARIALRSVTEPLHMVTA